MKKRLLFIILTIVFVVAGCVSPTVRHTSYQQKIEQKKEILNEDAKGFIVKATKMLTVQSGTVDINRVKDLLLKSQSILNVDVDDGNNLENLNGTELDKKAEEIFKKDIKEKNNIADLRKKDEEEISKILTSNIESEAIKKHERAKTIKWFAIGGTILSILGTLIFIFPSGFLRIGGNIIGFILRR